MLGMVLFSLAPRLATPPPKRQGRPPLLGWVVEYDRWSEEDFIRHRGAFRWVSPTWLVAHSDGVVVETAWSPRLVEAARGAGVKVVVLVANAGLRRSVVHSILSSGEARERFLETLLEVVEQRGYDGVNLDLEGVPPGDREAYTELVCRLAEELHRRGLELSVDVPAKTSDAGNDWSAAFDYGALARCADYVVVMAYDYHWSGGEPGPVSPLPWFREVLRYSLSRVPREKLIVGIPAYGYDWPAGGRGRGVTYKEAVETAERHGATVRFDEEAGEATYTYVEGGVRHVVWFSTARSMVERASLAVEAGVAGVAFWRVGSEDPAVWEAWEAGEG